MMEPPKSVEFNVYNPCIDDGELAGFCGTFARNPPLTQKKRDHCEAKY